MVRALGFVAALIMVLAVAGCGQEEEPTSAEPLPIAVPTFSTLKPAVDCAGSDLKLPAVAGDEGVLLEASTDDSGTSLLLKNTGNLSVLVVPDADWSTRVTSAPTANPTDAASKAALIAVTRAGGLQSVHELPVGIPLSQVFIVPPQWAVCGLTDDAGKVAGLRFLREKSTSAEYFLVKALADQAYAGSKPSAQKLNRTLLTCARGTQQLLKEHPDLPDIELYAQVLDRESDCRTSFKSVLSLNERTTQQTVTRLLNLLERSPRLLENTTLHQAFAHG
ncbi:hypothetical protein ACIBL3_19135 [Kribbella sp. NPDC050124]|uniref:hypothetical protein n=1 Tax=Kribbella sp. NPDC050124 TaxID=3364114 RepID=UPI0037936023